MDLKAIKQESKDAIVGIRLMLFLVLFVYFIIVGALANIGIGFLIDPILLAGVFLITKLVIKERRVDFNLLFNYFKDLNHAAKLLGVYLIYCLYVLVGIILLIIPGIIFMLQFSQAKFIIAENPEMGIMEALSKSKEIMDGHKWEFFVFYLSFIGHFILIGLTVGLYGIYILPYIQTAFVNYYLHLTNQQNTIQIETIA